MSMISPRTILVATDEGLHLVNGDGAARVDDLAGRQVGALAPAGDGWWALVDGRELWRSGDGFRWLSKDGGERWDDIAKGLAPVRAVAPTPSTTSWRSSAGSTRRRWTASPAT